MAPVLTCHDDPLCGQVQKNDVDEEVGRLQAAVCMVSIGATCRANQGRQTYDILCTHVFLICSPKYRNQMLEYANFFWRHFDGDEPLKSSQVKGIKRIQRNKHTTHDLYVCTCHILPSHLTLLPLLE